MANARWNWREKARRVKSMRRTARLVVIPHALPVVVTLTRIAPRPMDDDNLAHAFKAIRDGIADRLDVDDRDPRVQWRYGQERGEPNQYAIRIEISPGRVDVAS